MEFDTKKGAVLECAAPKRPDLVVLPDKKAKRFDVVDCYGVLLATGTTEIGAIGKAIIRKPEKDQKNEGNESLL